MAENEVKIKISVDADEAKQRIREIIDSIEKVYGPFKKDGQGASSYSGSSSGDGSSFTENSGKKAANTAAEQEQNRKNGQVFGEAAGQELSRINSQVSMLIFSKVLGMAGTIINDSLKVEYLRSIHAGANNYPLERELAVQQAQNEGALGGAMGGVMLGMRFGPWGALLGGLLGGIGVGGYKGHIAGIQADEHQRFKAETYKINDEITDEMGRWNMGRSFAKMALNRSLKMTGSREDQIDMLNEALNDIQFGNGDDSISSLSSKLKQMRKGDELWEKNTVGISFDGNGNPIQKRLGKPPDLESKDFKETEQKYQQAMQDRNEIGMQLFQTMFMKRFVEPMEGSQFADSFSKKGWFAGAQVDVASVNAPIIDNLTEIKNDMKRFIELFKEQNPNMNRQNELMREFNARYGRD